MTSIFNTRQWPFFKVSVREDITLLLMVAFGFSTLLLISGIIVTGDMHFAWLEWNLFLAFVPYWLSGYMAAKPVVQKSRLLFWTLSAAWLLFIPNAFYIITDLFHLNEDIKDPSWFNLLILFSFTWNGLLFGILSVRQMEKLLIRKFPRINSTLYLYPIMFLNAYGIYLGRYLRFNSWDIISDPASILLATFKVFVHPGQHAGVWGMVAGYAFMMMLIYNSIKKLSRLRW
jgi:uncharacterized membrane protein